MAIASVALLPVLLCVTVLLLRHHWYPASDWAYETLRTADVGTRRTPLVGVSSRYGWYHPGPLAFWLWAVPLRVLGTNGILCAVAATNALSIVGMLWVALRRGRRLLLVILAVGTTVLLTGTGLRLFIDPWNPWVAMWPFAFYLLALWAISAGDFPLIPWAVAAGSFAVQAHVGYTVEVVGLAAASAILTGITVRSERGQQGTGERGPRARPWLLAGLGVGVVLWAAPVIQQLSGHPGNLGEISHYFLHATERRIGWTYAIGVMGRELAIHGPWAGGRELNGTGFVAAGRASITLVVVAILAVLGGVAWRRIGSDAARLVALTLIGVGLGIVSTSQVTGELAPYMVHWWTPLAMLLWVTIAWIVLELLAPLIRRLVTRHRGRGSQRSVAAFAAAIVAVGASSSGLVAATAPVALPQPHASTTVGRLIRPAADAAEGTHKTCVVESVESSAQEGIADGLFVALWRRGVDVKEPTPERFAVGSSRVARPMQTGCSLLVVAGGDLSAGFAPPPGARWVATYDPLSPHDRAELDALLARARHAMGPKAPPGPILARTAFGNAVLVANGASAKDIARIEALQSPGDQYVVYLLDS